MSLLAGCGDPLVRFEERYEREVCDRRFVECRMEAGAETFPVLNWLLVSCNPNDPEAIEVLRDECDFDGDAARDCLRAYDEATCDELDTRSEVVLAVCLEICRNAGG